MVRVRPSAEDKERASGTWATGARRKNTRSPTRLEGKDDGGGGGDDGGGGDMYGSDDGVCVSGVVISVLL